MIEMHSNFPSNYLDIKNLSRPPSVMFFPDLTVTLIFTMNSKFSEQMDARQNQVQNTIWCSWYICCKRIGGNDCFWSVSTGAARCVILCHFILCCINLFQIFLPFRAEDTHWLKRPTYCKVLHSMIHTHYVRPVRIAAPDPVLCYPLWQPKWENSFGPFPGNAHTERQSNF
jgi:hypothetical protein